MTSASLPARPAWVDRLAAGAATARFGDGPPTSTGEGRPRPSAVLVLLGGNQAGAGGSGAGSPSGGSGNGGEKAPRFSGASVVLLERASTMRRHPGQVAFPGGAADPGDADPVATALREAHEEIGLDATTVEVIAALAPVYIFRSGYLVTPVLAYWRDQHEIEVVDPAEVAAVSVVTLDELSNPANRFTVRHPSGYAGPGFAAAGMFVWGFTAGVLDLVLRAGGWERAWDRTRTRGVPPEQPGFVPGTVGRDAAPAPSSDEASAAKL